MPAGARSYRDAAAHADTAREQLQALSRELRAVVVGGSYVRESEGRLYNTCSVWERGRLVGEHDKVHITERERALGISPGRTFEAIPARGLRLGIAICADVLEPLVFTRLRELEVDLVFAPTLSPYRPRDTHAEKGARDREIFASGARSARAWVVKTCGVGRIFGAHRLQGRSLIAAPDGTLVARVPYAAEGRVRILSAALPPARKEP